MYETTRRHYGTYKTDPVTGHKRRPSLTFRVTLKRFGILTDAHLAALRNGSYDFKREHYSMPGLARWHMKLERGLCR